MSAASFSLLTEPWVPVRARDGALQQVGLRELLLRAHEFEDLALASPPEYAGVFRLALLLLYRVFGDPETAGLGYGVWSHLWEAGRFDEQSISDYLERWSHRFDLFDPVRPFYQAVDIRTSKGIPAERAAVSLLAFDRSSGNNATLFDHSLDGMPVAVEAATAARLLVAFQSFAAGGRISNEVASGKAGLLRGGMQVFVVGASLWESLVLNLIDGAPLARTGSADLPAWERDAAAMLEERQPNGWYDPATWQARRVTLHPERRGDRWVVREVTVAGGSNPLDDSYVDPYWRRRVDSTGKLLLPIKLDPKRAIWRNAAAIWGYDEIEHKALRNAVIEQLQRRRNEGEIDESRVTRGRAIGMPTDKSGGKVLMWRNELFPLPMALLERADLLVVVREATGHAEDVWRKSVRWSLGTAAGIVLSELSNDGGRDVRREDCDALVATTAAEATYWSKLGQAFEGWVSLVTVNPEAAKQSWRAAVEQAARAAFEAGITGLGTSGRALKAAAVAHPALLGSLKKSLGDWGAPPPTDIQEV